MIANPRTNNLYWICCTIKLVFIYRAIVSKLHIFLRSARVHNITKITEFVCTVSENYMFHSCSSVIHQLYNFVRYAVRTTLACYTGGFVIRVLKYAVYDDFDGIIFFSISRNTCRSFCNAKSESDKLIVALHNISCTWAVLCCAQIIVHKAFLFTKVLVYSAVQRPQKGTNKNLILKLTCTQRKWTVPGLNLSCRYSCRYQHSLGSLSGQATA